MLPYAHLTWLRTADEHLSPGRPRPISLLPLGVLLLAGSWGCANLSAIRSFADISADTVRYKQLVRDYVTIAERDARYQKPCPACDRAARNRRDQEPALLLMQLTLQQYMDAMGELASDEIVDFSKEYGDLGNALSKANFASKADADAAAKIASLLTRAVTDAWRRRELRAIIEGANQPVQQLLASLGTEMAAFEQDVVQERGRAAFYYRKLAVQSRDKAGIAALGEWRDTRMDEIDGRLSAVKTYRGVLAKIAAGHQELFDNRNRLKARDVRRGIERYAKELKQAYKALRDARG